MFGVQFYPTPQELAYKLICKLDISRVNAVLEPSAGKGDFIEAFNKYRKEEMKTYSLQHCYYGDDRNQRNEVPEFFDDRNELLAYINEKWDKDFAVTSEAKEFLKTLDAEDWEWKIFVHDKKDAERLIEFACVEIDPDLCAILKEKRYFTTNANFLDWCSFSRYDTIIMNPPFADGDRHLLKAISLCENGGQIACILNAETIKNPCTQLRQLLAQKLDEYHADIEFVDDAFSDAERKADVDVALIYINIPDKSINIEVAKNFVKGDVYEKEYKEFSDTQLYAGDAISMLIEQFNLEARYGLKIIDTFNSMQQYIPKNKDNTRHLIALSVIGCSDEHNNTEMSQANRYIRALRQKYWELAFQTNQISGLLTDAARSRYQNEIRRFRDYDFTYSNIKQLQIELSQNLDSNIHDAIVNLYDNFTYKYSRENPQNVHLFNGWNTNQGFKINPKKVIYPLYLYQNYGGWGSYDVYKLKDFLTEVEKVFIYLDAGRTEGDTVQQVINKKYFNDRYQGEDLSFKYFDVEVKKKGTIHIKWKNDELIKKLTIIGCQAHGTLPNDYGTRKYSDLDKEHKDVVDAFEGEKKYQETVTNPQFYLNTSSMALLEMAQ